MANILLVPVRLDAFHADGATKLAAPLADFTGLPYRYHTTGGAGSSGPAPGPGTQSQPSGQAPPPSGGPPDQQNAQSGAPAGPRSLPSTKQGPVDQQGPLAQAGPDTAPPPRTGGPADQQQAAPAPSVGAANGDNPFLSNVVMRPPSPHFDGAGDTWTPPKGIHLHWKLPDALATQRVDPASGGEPRFPQVPNRWLVIVSTQSAQVWTQQAAWVVESDHLSAPPEGDPQGSAASGISFPIAPPQAFANMLTAAAPPLENPSPEDIAKYPFFYQAPFRRMGRKVDLATWQADSAPHEYLSDHNPAGLCAAGYGHPLFAAVYSNCSSVFGFHDPVSDGSYPRRYEVIGWYDDPATDCLALFRDLIEEPDPWAALKAEYQWAPPTVKDVGGDMPAVSAYFSRLEIPAALTGTAPAPDVQLTVGNTTGEALSAHLGAKLATDSGLDPAVRHLPEQQLEAIGLQGQVRGERLDLAARFEEARHDRAFKKRHGGSLWSVRARTPGQAAAVGTPATHGARAKAIAPKSEVTLPGGLAHLLDAANLAQKAYDDARDRIESLGQRAFSDWYRLESQLSSKTIQGLSSPDEIVAYSRTTALSPLQDLAARTGKISFARTSTGRLQVTASGAAHGPDVPICYTLAQALAQELQALNAALDGYNAGVASGHELHLVQKGAPRFYQPTEPAVLLAGDAVRSTGRTVADGELPCSPVAATGTGSLTHDLRANGLSSGAFAAILAQVESRAAAGGVGFATQTRQPWNPVVLEWEANVWPQLASNTAAGDYDAGYLDDTYALDVDAADLKLKVRPSSLTATQTAEVYSGRAILAGRAPARLLDAVAAYLLGLTLGDLKAWGARGHALEAAVDHAYDRALCAWASKFFATPAYPYPLADPATLDPEKLAEQQGAVAAWMHRQHPFQVHGSEPPALRKLSGLPKDWSSTRPVLGDAGTLATLGALTADEQACDPVRTAVAAALQVAEQPVLAQALGGFNDALLTRDRDLQLPVWDWRVTQEGALRGYARDLALSLGRDRPAPRPDANFLPIRSGLMQLPAAGLTLVDTFGQFTTLNFSAVAKSQRMSLRRNIASSVTDPASVVTAAEEQKFICLPPRLVQESRLDFRWLAADRGNAAGDNDETEMNDHPATTPVCGWLLPNNLDASLAVYGTDGRHLGSLVQGRSSSGAFAVVWEGAPGVNDWLPMAAIPNPHLRTLVEQLGTWGSAGEKQWTGWLANMNHALQDIDPKSFAEHPALALLIGRPIAVVRASLALRTMGLPATDHSAAAFAADLKVNRLERSTKGFEAVSIPLRLGEARQLDDGLVAYWVEDGSGGFVGAPALPELEVRGEATSTLALSAAAPPLKLTMLVDPRGCVHATTGILPVKTLTIPPDQYAKVLRTLSVTFLTSPVLTPAASVDLPLAEEAGYGWSWLDRPDSHRWNRVADIAPASRDARYGKQRILEGWLKLSPQARKEVS